MKIRASKSNKGIVLVAAIVFILILTILGFSVLSIANSEIILARKDINKAKAFYLAEAGLQVFSTGSGGGHFASIADTAMGGGTYRVDYDVSGSEPCAVATGTVGGQVKRIQVTVSFLAPPYEADVYAGGASGTPWTLIMRGIGSPIPTGARSEVGGKDIINGNMFVNGDIDLYQDSKVDHAPLPNTYGLKGDVSASGQVDLYNNASISGDITEGAAPQAPPDLVGMNYAVNNTDNVSQVFAANPVDSRGRLPEGNPLHDVFCKNPTYDRAAECASTPGVDDYFFEPSSGFIGGTWKAAPTPLHAGNDKIYYVDGDVWVDSKSDTYGFNMDGKVTIVATGNIHICDNLTYADASSMLGLVALGKYNSSGQLISGGNVIFGDPVYGTMYTVSAMMFAANDFLYNSKTFGTFSGEPKSGFTINGSLAALNHVSIERDWYDDWSGYSTTPRPARYNPSTGKWYDSGTGVQLTSSEVSSLRHYQMVVNYDDRVRNQSTQPKGLPKGSGRIFSGITDWKELP